MRASAAADSNALAAADAVVYDALVDARVLALARTDALLEYAGKRGGKPSTVQRDICERLIALAREGRLDAAAALLDRADQEWELARSALSTGRTAGGVDGH